MKISAALAAFLTLIAIHGPAALALEPDLESVLRFEVPPDGEAPGGWGGGPEGTIRFDGEVVHGGRGAARIARDADSPSAFSSLTRQVAIDFTGESIELRGFLRTEDVDGEAGLWMRSDGRDGPVSFTSMPVEKRAVRGTTGWTEYSIRIPWSARARSLYFGALLSGRGKLWVDDLELRVDGKPLAEAPRREEAKTVLDTDRQFAAGSGLELAALTATQVENAALLGRVWGFLKYHHPRVAGGELHWDFELFRVLPGVLAAADLAAGRRVLADWVTALGVPEGCDPCAGPPEDVHLLPRLDWLDDRERLGGELSERLRTIHARRYAGGEPFYVSQVPRVRNPDFDVELAYGDLRPPDAGYRILALFRLWNVVEYWFPYRDLLEDDWPAVLREFLPRLVEAADWDAYRLEMLAFIARLHDGHAGLRGELDVRPPRGDCRWPAALRFVEGRPTVTALLDAGSGEAPALEVGDVVTAIDGRPVAELIEAWSPYYGASNAAARRRDLAGYLPRGACGSSRVGIERRGEATTVAVPRVPGLDWRRADAHDRPGETFQLLSEEVAYLKLSSIRVEDVDRYLEEASGTRGLVIDIRNYPSEFVVFALGRRLIDGPTPFARFTAGDLANPGAFTWTEPLELWPVKPTYRGRVAILVDEASISQSEYTAMAFRAGPRAVVVGGTTAGADGNVSPLTLPGGLRTAISGIGVFYPDKTPTQRIGIVPDVPASPTIAGVREGRDEVLEAALRHLLGPDAEESAIRAMARRPPAQALSL